MPKQSRFSLETRKRVVETYNQIWLEAIPSANCGKKSVRPTPHAEIAELARCYGIRPGTIRKWAQQLVTK